MSYDLNFWRCKPGIALEPQAVYEQLSDGNTVDGLETLPLAQMLDRVRDAFAAWQQLDDVTYDGGERGGFQLTTTPQFFRVDCHEMDGADMNRFVDIAQEFHCCPLYDSQTGQRYDES